MPDEICYSAALGACEKGGEWALALSLLSSMPRMRATPNEISYNAAISACEKGGQWALALGLLSSMPRMQVTPNEISYSAAISACEKVGDTGRDQLQCRHQCLWEGWPVGIGAEPPQLDAQDAADARRD